MNKILVFFRNIVHHILSFLREIYNKRRKAQIKDSNISIISNDCTGGIIYHDLGLKFLSPTINLYFESDYEFIKFLKNISYYSACVPEQVFDTDKNYPIGILKNGEEQITIHFMHYKTFDEAVTKWIERGKRINYNNIFVILHIPDENGPSIELLKEFDALPFDKKMLITGNKCPYDYKFIRKLRIYSKNYFSGKILSFKSGFPVMRYLDDTKYIKFI